MTLKNAGVLFAVFVMSAAGSAHADPRPRNATAATQAQIVKIYAGRTELWKENCNGGIYFAPNWQVRAWCADSPGSLGAGTWTVDNLGNMCYTLTWYWPNGNRAGASVADQECIAHIEAGWKDIWRSWPGDAEWWPVDRRSDLTRGFVFQSEVDATRSRLGL